MLSHRKGVLLDGIGSELVRASTGGVRKTLSKWLGDLSSAITLGDVADLFTSGDATPSVLNNSKFITAGSTTITNFTNGVEGQTITIYRGASDIGIADNATIDPIIAGTLTLSTARPSATFRLASGVWKQVEEAGAIATTFLPAAQATTLAASLTALGLGTGDSPQFTAVNFGNASDTTVARLSAGDLSVEGNRIFRAGGADVPTADGGTGESTANASMENYLDAGAFTDLLGTTARNLKTRFADTINVLDWGIVGDDSTNNATAMAALATYLSGLTDFQLPLVYWPKGVYRYAASPNWSKNGMKMHFAGGVTLKCTATDGSDGFRIDSGATLASGYVWGIEITGQPRLEMVGTGGHAVFMRGLLRSKVSINARSAGSGKAAFRTDFCVLCDFTGCLVSNNEQSGAGFANSATPAYGVYSTRRGVGENSAHNTWGNVIIEGTTTGAYLDYCTGEIFTNGAIEGCTTGVEMTANCSVPRFFHVDVETNTTDWVGLMLATNPVIDVYAADDAARFSNTRLGRGHIAGLSLSNNGSDATNDIDFAVGECRDSTNAFDIVARTAMTKRLDASWAAGTNQGGLDTGSIANTTYHCYAIMKNADGLVDFLFSASATSPTMPTGYTKFRRIGSIIRTGGAIVAFQQDGDYFAIAPTFEFSGGIGGPAGARTNYTMTRVPAGIVVEADLTVTIVDTTPAAATYVGVTWPTQAAFTPSVAQHSFMIAAAGIAVPQAGSSRAGIRVNTSAQVAVEIVGTTADHTLYGCTHGWTDTRGRLA